MWPENESGNSVALFKVAFGAGVAISFSESPGRGEQAGLEAPPVQPHEVAPGRRGRRRPTGRVGRRLALPLHGQHGQEDGQQGHGDLSKRCLTFK